MIPESEWLNCRHPERMFELLESRGSARKRFLFGLACCRRIARLWTDPRVNAALSLIEQFADGLVEIDELAAFQPTLRSAVQDAFAERYMAEADANFSVHPALALAESVEAAVNAVAGLFDTGVCSLAPSAQMDFDWVRGEEPRLHAIAAVELEAEAFSLLASRHVHRQSEVADLWEIRHELLNRVTQAEEEAQSVLLREIVGNPFSTTDFQAHWRSADVLAVARGIRSEVAFDRLPFLADALIDAGCSDSSILDHCRGANSHVRECWVLDLLLVDLDSPPLLQL